MMSFVRQSLSFKNPYKLTSLNITDKIVTFTFNNVFVCTFFISLNMIIK